MGFLSLGVLIPLGLFIWTAWCLVSLVVNVFRARKTGLAYVIVPCSFLGAPWLLTQPLLLPLLNSLPQTWTENWLPLLLFNDGWHNGYEPFRRARADTFLAVSPGGVIFYTCDPGVSTQILHDGRLGKPAHLMSLLNLFGPTMTSSDGAEHRLYRRIAAPFFTDTTMQEVFVGSVQGGAHLVTALQQPGAYRQLRALTAKLSLHILSRFCNQTESEQDLMLTLRAEDQPTGRHSMTYSEAVLTVLENYMTIFLVPGALLRSSPSHNHRQAATAFAELGQYLQEMKATKEAEVQQNPDMAHKKTKSILDLLVQAGMPSEDGSPAMLRPDQVMGNLWVFVLAGHETNANTLTFIILLLACHPIAQRAMQVDLDRILQDTPPDQWTYEAHFSPLMKSRVGAVINETLRLFTVLPVIPKYVPPTGPPVSVTVQGCVHPLPRDTIAFVNTSATHRHPHYWPSLDLQENSAPLKNRPTQPFALSDFDPERWIQRGDAPYQEGLMTPVPGSFVPFSEGNRACLGYRFALVELCASVVAIFKSSSVRLLTRSEEDGGLTDRSTDSWETARYRAERALCEVKFDMSLRVVHDVPVQLEARN
ncbi:uncharacterized protein N7484_010241 [Penicillium longicatenatum]|uniref:uncharacterized protein n=1 Tax=Penicillium longicatenatum TaxID=1561947 RepID=UPI0025497CF3|nr:uncharacterized protein N7484_010241 [Penicillium longicatenatum]KAJ5636928.1 hypothetical protein N7484_010241 [Penicillium longicatenatum]